MGSILADEWLRRCQVTRFLKGQLIILPQVKQEYLYVIGKGAIKLFDITSEGTENTIAILGPDDLFPVNQLFEKRSREDVYYQAFTNCSLWRVSKQRFMEELASDSKALRLMLGYFIEKDLDYQLRIKGLEQLRADYKLAYILAFLVRKFGRARNKYNNTSAYEVDVPFTQQDFASLVGLTRETTCIQLKKLEKMGIVRYSRRRYTVYRDKLHDFVAEDLVPIPESARLNGVQI